MIGELLRRVGAVGSVRVTALDSGDSIDHQPHLELPLASVIKVPIVVAMARRADRGEVDPASMMELVPDRRSVGTTGISAMRDPVTLSLRDAAYLALTISDNAAADGLCEAIGGPAGVTEELAALDVPITMTEPLCEMYDRATATPELSADGASTGSAAACVRLLELVWRDEAASPAWCSHIRDLMARQVWQHRLGSGFPAPDVVVAGKTGTMARWRHEIGVVSFPGDQLYAVAVLTRQDDPIAHPDHDRTIGEIARAGVLALRRGSLVP
ncbi:serine hydrolase [Propionibacteriaceae bacterium Y2011]|uniref:serine hydrolase n=1 Tax=Microlunatus sp. Y2014 TaxID=3418488 RepID=UPI003B4D08B1